MQCLVPLRWSCVAALGFRCPATRPSGQCWLSLRGGRRISFGGAAGKGVTLPCGRCIGCRLERARQWAVRLMHERKVPAPGVADEASFITLTYNDEHLPAKGSLTLDDPQLFMKRLRKRLAPKRIRFFLCGEYGEDNARPHYHAIIFGESFPDRVELPKKARQKFALYRSDLLDEVWGKGHAWIGEVEFDSACYVANYATKKVTGEKAAEHYQGRKPEFLLMSRKPGIGKAFIDKFGGEVWRDHEVIVRGVEARPPRFYDKVLEKIDPARLELLKAKREKEAEILEETVLASGDIIAVAPSRNARRLAVREVVARAKLALKRRNLEK